MKMRHPSILLNKGTKELKLCTEVGKFSIFTFLNTRNLLKHHKWSFVHISDISQTSSTSYFFYSLMSHPLLQLTLYLILVASVDPKNTKHIFFWSAWNYLSNMTDISSYSICSYKIYDPFYKAYQILEKKKKVNMRQLIHMYHFCFH